MEGICTVKIITGEEWVVFDRDFNSELTPDIIKFLSNYQRVIFGCGFPDEDLPEERDLNLIYELILGAKFNQPVNNLPNSITHLILGGIFNHPVDISNEDSPTGKSSILPNSITFLVLGGEDFNQPVDNLPESVTELIFGYRFNQPINNLPNGLKTLKFYEHSNFNQPVDNLPDSLTYLHFGDCFNQSIEFLPENLKELYLGNYYDLPINNLPSSLIYLNTGHGFNQAINNLPSSLKKVELGQEFDQALCLENLSNLTDLTICDDYNKSLKNIPESVTHFKINGDFLKENYEEDPLESLPRSITHFTVAGKFDFLPVSTKFFKAERGIFMNDIKNLIDTIQEITMPNIPPNIHDHIKKYIPKNIKVNFY